MLRCLTRFSLALLLLSSEVWAIGLGEVRLESALNEPLRAEIELLSASEDELQNLQVALASADTFTRYGLDRPYYLQEMKFEVVRSARAGESFVRVSTQAAMTEPFLTFLVEATWSSGRLLREYTVLLNPPTFAPAGATEQRPQVVAPARSNAADSGNIERTPAPGTPSRAPATTRVPAASTQGPASEPATSQVAPKPQPPRDTTPYDANAGGDYNVARGQTLWGIASSVRPDSRLTMNQTMLAIYEANPEAFGGNINILRAGARLRIPSADEIYRIDRGMALAEAQRQNAAWSGGTVPAAGPTQRAPAETRPSLTLVPPDEEPADLETGMDGEISDDTSLREQEIEDRIADLEAADVPEQRSLIEIRNNELASLRQELADIRGEAYEPQADEGPFVEEDADTEAPEAADGELFPDYDELAAADAAAEDAEAEPAADERDSTTIISSRDRNVSFVDKLLGWLTNIWVMIIGVALLVAIGILVWFMRRSGGDDSADVWGERLGGDDEPVESMAATESLRAPRRHDESMVVVEQGRRSKVVEEDTLEAPAPDIDEDIDDSTLETGRFESLEDTFSSDTAVNLDQSDPIAEADFHMAYGLYDQAADLINGALQAEPKRQDLLTKLCEIYFVWGNRDAFIDAAERLQKASGGNADEWDKIVIMGQQIAADYPLFAGAGVTGVTRAIDLALDDDGQSTGALDMDFGADSESHDEVIDLGADDGSGDDGVDFLFDDEPGSDDDTARNRAEATVEMPGRDVTVESPTIEEQFAGLDSTNELPSLANKLGRTSGLSNDATAEIDLDDLDLDLDGLAATELASLDDLDDNDATELASLDDLDDFDEDETGTRDALSDTSATGRQPQIDTSATGMMDALELDDDLLDSSGMRLADDETGQNPMIHPADETAGDSDEDLLAATGRTQVLGKDQVVRKSGKHESTLSDDDATLLAKSFSDGDFDYAATEALPAGTYSRDSSSDDTGEIPAIASTDVDLDLDDLTAALKQTDIGDTIEQPRDDKTVEQPRPRMRSDNTVDTLALSPDDMSSDLHEARTMTEVGTKLDLARAYVDMGDPAGARSILEEVLDEGDAGQRQQAQHLLDTLPT